MLVTFNLNGNPSCNEKGRINFRTENDNEKVGNYKMKPYS